MNRSRMSGVAYIYALTMVTPAAAWASPITISYNYVAGSVGDTGANFDSITPTSIPAADALVLSDGNSSSTLNLNYSGNASSATLAYDFAHSIDNTVGDTSGPDYAQSITDTMDFTATVDATYTIDGLYNMTGPAGTRTYMDVSLYDLTDGLYLLWDLTESIHTPDTTFVLGMVGDGDTYNVNSGAVAGHLLAGHNYRLRYQIYIQAFDGSQISQVAATASGHLNLHISAVPVPAAAWLFVSGLLAFIGISRR